MNSSLAARFGHLLQPALAPILDPDHKRPEAWKDGVALTAGFVAKEIVVSTMGVVNQAKAEKDADGPGLSPLQETLRQRLRASPRSPRSPSWSSSCSTPPAWAWWA